MKNEWEHEKFKDSSSSKEPQVMGRGAAGDSAPIKYNPNAPRKKPTLPSQRGR
jgi:hypothetical protein